jgi:methyltransferase OMS1
MNKVLDKTAIDHAKKWGCWWNRDIIELLQQSGLEIISIQRYHFGTTYEIIAKPK